MRLFVGVPIPVEAAGAAEDVTASLAGGLPREVRVRWVRRANMHLTVRFIGHVPDERVPAILDALSLPLPVPAFDIQLGNCGVFPPGGAPRVIWIGLRAGVASLRRMHDEMNRRLAPFGYEPESRAFTVHLTLARISDAPRASAKDLRDAVLAVRAREVVWRATSATVFESRLSPHGPTYHPLLDIPCLA